MGRGKKKFSGVGRLANELIGGWQTTGIVRWTTASPLINNGAYYPTNWDIRDTPSKPRRFPRMLVPTEA